ncbi:hypothetical protein [Deinococcus humi]|uniref:Uncharacterized protein n=1 Tax=Deinococcus humi TaxID=662880 RepID=A0A7W8K1C5_9DEIO|nr:hypothetical protein [Deinococcus humi]MBB5365666.1 hypothetical protein [Deinococcus humi]GGO36995.1 hypothetical protein GCM10008949_41720 [Deinococcus humi]
MTHHQDLQTVGRRRSPPLTADECRLVADRVLGHLGRDAVRNDALTYLAGRLFSLAVQVEQPSSSLPETGGAAGAPAAPEDTPLEVRPSAAQWAV